MTSPALPMLFAAIRQARATEANRPVAAYPYATLAPIATQAAKLGWTVDEAQREYDRRAGVPW